ncbi:something about silencing protein sas10 [Dorcoceras hygrometricum]|uniref:Something about silencing protein sas10 n=1 Tax=Dorcoceras hygrometricum TaxID=472368 RepID=A0A2Z7BV10_9LAMI|nr:something about silencing protein sas10 [Dorcoceras hygrometricum]
MVDDAALSKDERQYRAPHLPVGLVVSRYETSGLLAQRRIRIPLPGRSGRFQKLILHREWRLAPTNFTRKSALQRLAVVVLRIRSTTEIMIPSSVCTRKRDESFTDGTSSSRRLEQVRRRRQRTAHGGGRRKGAAAEEERERRWAAYATRVWSCVVCHVTLGHTNIDRLVMGLNRPNGPGSGPVPYEHSVQLHHRGSIIIPIDNQIGPIYTVYKTEDTASREPTTIATPKPYFRTSPSDHGTDGDNGGSGSRFTGAPGSDQFNKETGTSKARFDSPRQYDRNKSDHGGGAAAHDGVGGGVR